MPDVEDAAPRRPAPSSPAANTPQAIIQEGTAELHHLQLPGGGELTYALLRPAGFRAVQEYPVLVGMPPGAEDLDMVRFTLGAYWGEAATERGWVVVSPAAPPGGWRNEGGARAMRALLADVAERVHPEGERFYLAGVSNGGNSAFYLAVAMPERFAALVTLPGSVGGDGAGALGRLVGMPVRLHVGARDGGWRRAAEQIEARLRALGGDVELTVWPNEGHVIRGLADGELMRRLEQLRQRHAGSDR